MSARRRPGAPRLIQWTGERCVPWAPDVQVVYEHLHRYMWAAQWLDGMRVLDLASGEGFGTAILADTAASVVGIDIDPVTVEHSRLNYGSKDLEFEVADALQLSRFPGPEFDAVVAFEMVEHVEDHIRLMAEIRRVLKPGGLLIMSTPERQAYRDVRADENPYHVHELDAPEFRQLLADQFTNVRTWGQRALAGSALHPMETVDAGPPDPILFVEREGDSWPRVDYRSPVYMVAMASDAALPAASGDSVLADVGTDLIEAHRQIQHLQESLVSLQEEYGNAIQLMRRVEESITWTTFQTVRRHAFRLLGGEESRRVRAFQWALGVLAQRRRPARRRRLVIVSAPTNSSLRHQRLEFPTFAAPRVSIVIPVFRRAELTRRCLASILAHTLGIPYEVILVDDASDEATQELLATVRGAKLIINPENLGYLRSVNRGSAEARAPWLVLANNDIEVQPGWLRELVRCGESAPDIAVVTPRYVYPDGGLSEAGGIVWSDGTAANFGRGDHADSWRYGYRRDVDYGSAAAMLVRTDFWRERGGYDETFLPMYYEDTDLCFDAREQGLRVIYEPEAIVVHHEGGTAGTDTSVGYKRHQDENRVKFRAKWARRLEEEHLPPGSPLLPASQLRGKRPHVLIVDHRIPTPDRDSGSLRMQGIIEILIEAGCRVTLLPDNLQSPDPYRQRLARLGVAVIHGLVEPVEELAELGPTIDVAVLSRAETASRWLMPVREAASGASIVYDTVDLHWLREARRYWHEQGAHGDAIGPAATELREQELELVRSSDITLVVSDAERELVELDVPDADVRVIPNIHHVADRVAPRSVRAGLLFVGGFEHVPNVEAVHRLVKGVMPRVWDELPDLAVMVVGGDPPPDVQSLASERVRIAGWVADLEPLLSSSVLMLAPLSYGAGVKGKVTQALSAGLPVVTTPTGVEGTGAVDGEHLLVGEDDAQLARAVVRLVGDTQLWERLSQAGRALIAERYSADVVRADLLDLLPSQRDPFVST